MQSGIQEWVDSWMSESVFSLGRGRNSAAAWHSTVLETDETRPGCHVHAFAADVIKSLDTVDRRMLDCVFGHLGLPAWFRHVLIEFHAQSRLRLKLAAWVGEAFSRGVRSTRFSSFLSIWFKAIALVTASFPSTSIHAASLP